MATYWVKSGTGGTDAGTSWSNAAESIAGLMAAQAIAGGDIIYVHVTHNYLAGAAITWTLPESGSGMVQVLCVDGGDATGASLVDGTVGNLTTGAIESTNGNFAFSINANGNRNSALFVHGITFKTGSGGNDGAADFFFSTANQCALSFNACTFWTNSTSTGALTSMGINASFNVADFRDCVFRYGSTSQYIGFQAGVFRFKNCSVSASGSAPSAWLRMGDRSTIIECSSCDFSNVTNLVDIALSVGKVTCSNCAINTPVTGSYGGYASGTLEFHACDPADAVNGANILSYFYQDVSGTVQDNQTVYKATGGAQGEQDDGTDTSYSLQMDPSTSASPLFPLYTPWVYTLVGSTGPKTIAMKVAHTETAVLTDLDIFMEVEYMGEPGATGTQRVANSPMSIIEVDDDAPVVSGTIYRDVLSASASNRTDDALDDWAGLTSEKEHTLTATVACDEVGYIRCRVGLTKDTTNPVYVDPKISVT